MINTRPERIKSKGVELGIGDVRVVLLGPSPLRTSITFLLLRAPGVLGVEQIRQGNGGGPSQGVLAAHPGPHGLRHLRLQNAQCVPLMSLFAIVGKVKSRVGQFGRNEMDRRGEEEEEEETQGQGPSRGHAPHLGIGPSFWRSHTPRSPSPLPPPPIRSFWIPNILIGGGPNPFPAGL